MVLKALWTFFQNRVLQQAMRGDRKLSDGALRVRGTLELHHAAALGVRATVGRALPVVG